MSVAKIAVSLPKALLAEVRQAVAREGCTFSAFVARALKKEARQETLEGYLADALARTGGPMTDAEREEADRVLGYAPEVKTAKRPRAGGVASAKSAKSRAHGKSRAA